MSEGGITCTNCNKIVNYPQEKLGNEDSDRIVLTSRPSSFWIDTPDGSGKALCYPCSWNQDVSKRYPKLIYKKKFLSSTAIAVSRYPEIKRIEQVSEKSSIGPIGWYLILFVVFAIVGGLLTMNESSDTSNPNSGYNSEWNADNSIDGPTGTFDDQSKP